MAGAPKKYEKLTLNELKKLDHGDKPISVSHAWAIDNPDFASVSLSDIEERLKTKKEKTIPVSRKWIDNLKYSSIDNNMEDFMAFVSKQQSIEDLKSQYADAYLANKSK
jgi:hypothetical protein